MDIFDSRTVKPMLIGLQAEPFDDPDYLFELKLDGGRYLGYFQTGGMELISKRNVPAQFNYPEFSNLCRQLHARKCILDGEIMVMHNGRPDFRAYSRRALIKDRLKIELASRQYPAVYVVYDIIYKDGRDLRGLPLAERLEILAATVEENDFINISRTVDGSGGKQFCSLVRQMGLEGAVAKRKQSIYRPGARSKDWIKIKNWLDEDFVIGGYDPDSEHVASLLLGQFSPDGQLVYMGSVTIGKNNPEFQLVRQQPVAPRPPFVEGAPQPDRRGAPHERENVVWLQPTLVCNVEFIDYTPNGGLRQPAFRGLRPDRRPADAVLTAPQPETEED